MGGSLSRGSGTALSAARMFTPLGNHLVARPAARSAARKITDATEIPLDAAMVLGITANALHVWKADPMLEITLQARGAVHAIVSAYDQRAASA